MKYADLHLHTSFSDGAYSPEGLVNSAVKAGLAAIAVTDHDTVSGVALAIDAAKDRGVEVIPGIELSAEEGSQEVHILGYFIDYNNNGLLKRLGVLKQNRIERIYKIAEKLNGLGAPLEPEAVFKLAGGGTVGRLHIARALVSKGFVKNNPEAFQRYIGDRSPAYVLGFRFSAKDAIALIREVGGIPVLAHPYSMHKDELIPVFVDYGLMGLEVYYPEHSQSMINFYSKMAEKLGLLVAGGSDCHGDAKEEVKIGMIRLPYEFVEKLKAARKAVL